MKYGPDLKTFQLWFQNLIATGKAEPPETVGWLVETPSFSIKDRVSVYSYAYFQRIYESVIQDFPVTARWIDHFHGADAFKNFFRSYLTKYPSRSPSLAQVGDRLPQFLKNELKDIPKFVFECADFEWAAMRAFFCPIISSAATKIVEQTRTKAPTQIYFQLNTSVTLQKTAFSIGTLFKKGVAELPITPPLKQKSFYLHYQGNGLNQFEGISESHWQCLNVFEKGGSLMDGISCFENPQEVKAAFEHWSSTGILQPLLK